MNGPYHSVPTALKTLNRARNRDEASRAYHLALDAIGHDHSGTVYAAFVPALPLLMRIACAGKPWAQYAALEVITDALAWLPEGPALDPVYPTRADVRDVVASCSSGLKDLLTRSGVSDQVRASALELLETISDLYGTDNH